MSCSTGTDTDTGQAGVMSRVSQWTKMTMNGRTAGNGREIGSDQICGGPATSQVSSVGT